MNVKEQIKKYITGQPEPKRSDLQELHRITLQVLPGCKLWFFDGKNSENKTVSNPNIGYGFYTMEYASFLLLNLQILIILYHETPWQP